MHFVNEFNQRQPLIRAPVLDFRAAGAHELLHTLRLHLLGEHQALGRLLLLLGLLRSLGGARYYVGSAAGRTQEMLPLACTARLRACHKCNVQSSATPHLARDVVNHLKPKVLEELASCA
jgi:hypothetical protein